jgi:protein-tyrosine phosphatase
MEASLAMCAMGARDGITHVVAAVHLFHNGKCVPVPHIERELARLKAALVQDGQGLQISAATETPIMEDIVERIGEGQIIPLDPGGRYILLESPHAGMLGSAVVETVVRLRSCGVTPVVAHPEVSEAFRENSRLAQEVVQRGAVMQVTASALGFALESGRRGMITGLLERGLIHVVASDAHDTTRRVLRLSDAFQCCAEALGPSCAELLFETNPQRILAGAPVLQPKPTKRRVSRLVDNWVRRRRLE